MAKIEGSHEALLDALLVDYAAQKVIIDELHDDAATIRTEIIAIGTTLADVKAIYEAHVHEAPGSSHAHSRSSLPDTGGVENALAASAASTISDTSGSSVPETLGSSKTALTVTT